jgi:twinkle protein
MTDDFVSNFNIRDKDDHSIDIPNVFTANDFLSDIKKSYLTGNDLGLDFGMKPFKGKFTWRPQDVNVWSGYMNEGKSQLLMYSAILASLNHGWKWLVHSPENMPEYVFMMDMIHTVLGESLDIRYTSRPQWEKIVQAADWISKHFLLIENGEGYSIDNLLESAKLINGTKKINGLIIDPWNQLHHDQESNEREDQYISRQMTKVKSFAKKTNVNVNIVTHQITVRINKSTGNYDKPNIMHISGGAMFGNKADNTISVWRPYRYSEPDDHSVEVNFDKIKKKKLTGFGGQVPIRFDLKKNRYYWHESNSSHGDGQVVTGLEKLKI